MAIKHFVDTHTFLWYLAGSTRLGSAAKAILQDPTSELFLPATALAEACWIVESGRVTKDSNIIASGVVAVIW